MLLKAQSELPSLLPESRGSSHLPLLAELCQDLSIPPLSPAAGALPKPVIRFGTPPGGVAKGKNVDFGHIYAFINIFQKTNGCGHGLRASGCLSQPWWVYRGQDYRRKPGQTTQENPRNKLKYAKNPLDVLPALSAFAAGPRARRCSLALAVSNRP